jgi:triacylglycerol lipase
MPDVNIWHPFWLPKMVLDGVEEKERSRLKKKEEQGESLAHTLDEKGTETALWANEREWGNDGLVTVQSAKWGEFLGIMEGCDHWEMRGARGIEFGVDLPALPAIGLGGNSNPGLSSSSPTTTTSSPHSPGDGWGFRDWGRFVGAWKREEKKRSDAAAAAVASAVPMGNKETQRSQVDVAAARDDEEEVARSSTDKLSLVFDWLIDQIPAPQLLVGGKPAKGNGTTTESKVVEVEKDGGGESTMTTRVLAERMVVHTVAGSGNGTTGRGGERTSEMKKRMDKEGLGRKKNELASKADLERFYVALLRKMYDEGL